MAIPASDNKGSGIFTDSLPALIPAILILLEGIFSYLGSDTSWISQISLTGYLAVIYLLISSLFIPPENHPAQVKTSLLLTACYLSSAIIIGFLSKAYYLEEKRQVSLDTLNTRETPLMTHLEFIYFNSLKEDTRDFIAKWQNEK